MNVVSRVVKDSLNKQIQGKRKRFNRRLGNCHNEFSESDLALAIKVERHQREENDVAASEQG